MQIKEAQEEFLNYIKAEKGFSRNTVLAYKSDIDKLTAFLQNEKVNSIEEVDRFHLSDFIRLLESENLQVSSRARKVASVKSFFNYLHRKEIIPHNPAALISQPKVPRKLPQYLTESESRVLLRTILRTSTEWYQIRDYCITLLFLNTGIRLSELCDIKLTDFDLEEKSIKIFRKGNKEAYIYLDDDTLSFLKRWIKFRKKYKNSDKSQYLFLSKWGKPICASTVIEMIKSYSIKAGIVRNGNPPLTPHKLRHSFATRLLSKGENLRTVQELLGHTSINSTQIYTHITQSELRSSIERQRL